MVKKVGFHLENKKWQKVKLGEVSEEIREMYSPVFDECLRYIGLEHIEQNTLKLVGTGDSSKTKSSKKLFKTGDILFGTLRPYFRKVVKPKFDGVCSTDITVIRSKENCCQDFLFYFIANQNFIDYATNISYGTRMPRSPWEILAKSEWSFPPLHTQKKISSILSAYDDLIENNTRRIQILEEIAQMIYKEWFVNFRFPGYEETKFVDSELGKIPEGWKVKVLNDIITYQGGTQPPKTEHIYEPRRGYIRFIQNRDYNSHQHPTFIKIDRKNRTCTEYDIMIDKYGEVGTIRFGLQGAYNVALAKIDPVLPNSREYIRGYLKQEKVRQYLNNASGASTRGSLNKSHFNLKVPVPNSKLLLEYEIFSKTVIALIVRYRKKNKILRQTRDLLLPKLISGELDVSDMDIEIKEEESVNDT